MERSKQFLIIAAAVAIVVLLGALAMSYMSLQAAQNELKQYKEQQRQTALAVMAEHMQDMQAARSWWISTHQDEYRELQAGASRWRRTSSTTPYYTAVLDPANPYYVSIGPPGNAEPGELIIGLGQYFADNMTAASGRDRQLPAQRHHARGHGLHRIARPAHRLRQLCEQPGRGTSTAISASPDPRYWASLR